MNPLYATNRIFLMGGPGGVGKTTLSAALAITLAERGYSTIVLTVDPAKRLAQALGLTHLGNTVQRVPLQDPSHKLWASQLSTDRFLDELIHRIAKSPLQETRILANPIYQTLSKQLGGSEEYAAMERILEFAEASYDKIIVDTPPTQNAVDLLTAPQRMFDFMDTSVLKWFSGKTTFFSGIFGRSTHLALKALQRLFGNHFFDALEGFLRDIDGLQAGFQSRNFELARRLKANDCAFLLATTATQDRVTECSDVRRVLEQEGIALRLLLINQFEPEPPTFNDAERAAYPNLAIWRAFLSQLNADQQQAKESLKALSVATVTLNRLDQPPTTISELSTLGNRLVDY